MRAPSEKGWEKGSFGKKENDSSPFLGGCPAREGKREPEASGKVRLNNKCDSSHIQSHLEWDKKKFLQGEEAPEKGEGGARAGRSTPSDRRDAVGVARKSGKRRQKRRGKRRENDRRGRGRRRLKKARLSEEEE